MKLKKLLASLALLVITIGAMPLNLVSAVNDLTVGKFTQGVMRYPGDESVPGLYGIILSGNQTMNGPDTESNEAIYGDLIGAKGASVQVAGNYGLSEGLAGLGIDDRQRIGVLLNGTLVGHEGTSFAFGQGPGPGSDVPGYIVPKDSNLDSLLSANILRMMNGNATPNVLTMTDDEMATTFDKLMRSERATEDTLAELVANPLPYKDGSVVVGGPIYATVQESQISLESDDEEPAKVLVIDVPIETYNGERVAMVPPVAGMDDLIKDETITQIVYTCSDPSVTKAIFFGANMHNGAQLPPKDPFINEAAKKITYYLPNMTQVINFGPQKPASEDASQTVPDLKKGPNGVIDDNNPISSTGEDSYNLDFFKPYTTQAQIYGSVIAPLASVMVGKGGNINGYVRAKNLHLRDGGEVHNFYNNLLTPVEMNLNKLDPFGKGLPGAIFKLKDDKTGEVNEINMANAASVEGISLEHGHSYTLTESQAPNGYKPIGAPITIRVNAAGKIFVNGNQLKESNPNVAPNVSASLVGDEKATLQFDITDDKDNPHFAFTKVDNTLANDSQALEGAVFALYTDKDGKRDAKITKDITSNSAGLVAFDAYQQDLVVGATYWIHEETAPAGYQAIDDIAVTVADDGTGKLVVTGLDGELKGKPITVATKINDLKAPANITVTKKGLQGAALKGAEFTLYRYDSTKPNDRGEQVGEPVLTDSEGKVGFADLDWSQKYVVVETKAPIGYKLPTDGSQQKTIDFQDGGKLTLSVAAAFTDTLKPITIHLNKVSKWLGDQLEGAEFTLFDKDGKQIGDPITTGKAGDDTWNFALTGLEAGQSYTLKETKAPAGYTVDHKAYTVVVAEDGKRVTVTPVDAQEDEKEGQTVDVVLKDGEEENLGDGVVKITNTPTTILPHTGGSGSDHFTLALAVTLLGAAFALGTLTWLKRREVRDHE
ncbi:SpaA isopeptide-forming pilin-related protein [Lacticaseibacillus kribbianus]|uniref:SpaA isopeptide-forming pilin-related protein n=1 Tax=Lacticaseibacillus kribbianus TaxID=2926292 RepID=UPI001CD1ED30|nr:SpaA isopeptide-forming pilin-related protein [Lacticaseibacillus kribbianus]